MSRDVTTVSRIGICCHGRPHSGWRALCPTSQHRKRSVTQSHVGVWLAADREILPVVGRVSTGMAVVTRQAVGTVRNSWWLSMCNRGGEYGEQR